jgi:hypothetical protein
MAEREHEIKREPQQQQSRQSNTDAIVEQWFNDSFRNSRLGNDTETWNLVHQAKEELKQRLRKA